MLGEDGYRQDVNGGDGYRHDLAGCFFYCHTTGWYTADDPTGLHTVVLGLEFASKIRSALAASKNYIAHYSSAHRAQPELESSADVKPRRSVVKGPQVIHELDGSLEFGFFLAGRAATAIGIPQAGLV